MLNTSRHPIATRQTKLYEYEDIILSIFPTIYFCFPNKYLKLNFELDCSKKLRPRSFERALFQPIHSFRCIVVIFYQCRLKYIRTRKESKDRIGGTVRRLG